MLASLYLPMDHDSCLDPIVRCLDRRELPSITLPRSSRDFKRFES